MLLVVDDIANGGDENADLTTLEEDDVDVGVLTVRPLFELSDSHVEGDLKSVEWGVTEVDDAGGQVLDVGAVGGEDDLVVGDGGVPIGALTVDGGLAIKSDGEGVD